MNRLSALSLIAGSLAVVSLLVRNPAAAAAPRPQAASPSPEGPRVDAFQDVNVRNGPGTEYDQVGLMIKGQSAPILGRSPDGFWIKIVYVGGPGNTGWVYRDLVRVIGDVPSLPTIVPPPTPTLVPTKTPEVVLPAGTATPEPGRLPTFTAAPPVVRPTLLPVQGASQGGRVPPALVIISLFVLGSFGGMVSLLRRQA